MYSLKSRTGAGFRSPRRPQITADRCAASHGLTRNRRRTTGPDTRRSETVIPRATVELPLAQHILPPGLASNTYKRFNQVRKALATAYYLHITHHGMLSADDIASLAQHQMATAARSAGVEAPTSDETREMIRSLLRVFNGIDAPASAPVPLQTVRVTESELATALGGLAVVVQAAAQGVGR